MSVTSRNPILDRIVYERAARDYCESLPLEHFMESTPQQTQRRITLAAFDLIHADRPDVWCYNELLIQYPLGRAIREIGRAVPDNLVVLHDRPLNGTGSFNTPFEQARLFLAMEYVSPSSQRKDYVENMAKYESLRIPYYLLFEPELKELLVFRLGKKRVYQSVKPDATDRLPVPELDLEVGMADGWARFWFRGRLLPQTSELAAQLKDAEAEIARLKAELAGRKPSP